MIPERGFELLGQGRGTGAWKAFKIVGPPAPIAFLACQTVTPESKGPPGDYSGDPLWQIVFNQSYDPIVLPDVEAIVREAMIAYKAVFGFNAHLSELLHHPPLPRRRGRVVRMARAPR